MKTSTITTISGGGGQFWRIRPLLSSWLHVLEEYARQSGDNPWMYRERPQIGFLAAAAWLKGGVALEEWGMKKHAKNSFESQKTEHSSGRNDLWIWFADWEWFFEAKFVFCEIERGRQHIKKRLDSGIQEAKNAAKYINHACCQSDKKIKVAALFVAPTWEPKGKGTNSFSKDLKQWQEECDAIDIGIAAHVMLRSQPQTSKGNCVGSSLFLLEIQERL